MIQERNERRRVVTKLSSLAPRSGNIPFHRQERRNWCWAACARMMIRALTDPGVEQCDTANFLFQETNCCQKPNCNSRCRVDDVAAIYKNWKIHAPVHKGRIKVKKLRQAVAGHDQAVQLGFDNGGRSGHLILVVGHVRKKIFRVHDPQNAGPTPTVKYRALKDGYGFGSWTHTWPTIREV